MAQVFWKIRIIFVVILPVCFCLPNLVHIHKSVSNQATTERHVIENNSFSVPPELNNSSTMNTESNKNDSNYTYMQIPNKWDLDTDKTQQTLTVEKPDNSTADKKTSTESPNFRQTPPGQQYPESSPSKDPSINSEKKTSFKKRNRYIIKMKNEINDDGSFEISKKFDDGSIERRIGYFKDINGIKIFVTEGEFTSYLPNGDKLITAYTNDENGFLIYSTIRKRRPGVPFGVPAGAPVESEISSKAINILIG